MKPVTIILENGCIDTIQSPFPFEYTVVDNDLKKKDLEYEPETFECTVLKEGSHFVLSRQELTDLLTEVAERALFAGWDNSKTIEGSNIDVYVEKQINNISL